MIRLRIIPALALISGGFAGLWQALAQDKPAVPARVNDIENCLQCHTGPMDRYRKTNQTHLYFKTDEAGIWEKHDPHSKAFAVLTAPAANTMTENLKKLYNDPNYSPTRDARCLTCHATDFAPQPYTKPLSTEEVASRFLCSEGVGVGCVACHHLNSSTDWITAHQSVATWRKLDVAARTTSGLRDLRDPATKARLCASCHIGNAAQGKVITHDMYAAGHPPLLPLELVSYIEQQPRHFFLPAEVEANIKASSDANKAPPPMLPEYDDYHARHLAIGAVAALQAEADLLAADAGKPGGGPLDFARFDCYACHHDLKLPSDRQARGYDGPPGRPPLKAWIGTFADTIAHHSGDDAQKAFTDAWQKLSKAATAQPYGDAGQLKPAAQAMSQWCDAELTRLKTPNHFNAESVQKLKGLLESRLKDPKATADAESTMALLWAYRSLHPQRNYSSLEKVLPTTLRTKEQVSGPQPVTILPDLGPKRMSLFNSYDARSFREAFAAMLSNR